MVEMLPRGREMLNFNDGSCPHPPPPPPKLDLLLDPTQDTVTSSNSKIKIARSSEFVFNGAWRWSRNKSLVSKILHFIFSNCRLAWDHDTKLFGWEKMSFPTKISGSIEPFKYIRRCVHTRVFYLFKRIKRFHRKENSMKLRQTLRQITQKRCTAQTWELERWFVSNNIPSSWPFFFLAVHLTSSIRT